VRCWAARLKSESQGGSFSDRLETAPVPVDIRVEKR
jgi:hypothetical protein